MALTKCKECGNEISTAAAACPKCGAKITSTSARGCLIVILAVVFIAIFSSVLRSCDDDEKAKSEAQRIAALTPEQRATEQAAAMRAAAEKAEQDELSTAPYACEDFITKSLHDPDSAKFEDARTFFVEKNKLGYYRVQAKLRAKNGFGALRLMTVECKISLHGGTWTALEIKEIN